MTEPDDQQPDQQDEQPEPEQDLDPAALAAAVIAHRGY